MKAKMVLLAAILILVQIAQVFSLPGTSPAFLWTPNDYGLSYDGVKDTVKYQTVSPNELANSVLNEAGWSDFVCSADNAKVDLALVFIGRKLHSSDISKNKQQEPLLTDTLKASFTSSNFSMAFPYVDTSDKEETLESSLIKGFSEKCGQDFAEKFLKLNDLNSIQEFVASKGENKKTNMILFNHDGLEELDGGKSEGEILSSLLSLLSNSGFKYTILYASEPYRFDHRTGVARLLEESALSNSSSSNSTTCDEICRMKASLLEGVLVGITLLIILISGLCCMMGIDTPSRFETPQE
ncbi:hypothetical protein LUZ60_015487 [Juncus effusus]|nr:hypothetical protein LUZ60_015487 [Juncus effusus]